MRKGQLAYKDVSWIIRFGEQSRYVFVIEPK